MALAARRKQHDIKFLLKILLQNELQHVSTIKETTLINLKFPTAQGKEPWEDEDWLLSSLVGVEFPSGGVFSLFAPTSGTRGSKRALSARGIDGSMLQKRKPSFQKTARFKVPSQKIYAARIRRSLFSKGRDPWQ